MLKLNLIVGRGLLLFLLFNFFTAHAMEDMTSKIANFKLLHCGVNSCVKITAKQAVTSSLRLRDYAFDKAQFTLYNRTTKKMIKSFSTDDGFFDTQLQRVFLRNVEKNKNKEAIYDLLTEQLYEFNLEKSS